MANLLILNTITRLEATLFFIAPIIGLLLIMVLIEAAAKAWPILQAAKQQPKHKRAARHRMQERKAI
jgi:hypothetical protein